MDSHTSLKGVLKSSLHAVELSSGNYSLYKIIQYVIRQLIIKPACICHVLEKKSNVRTILYFSYLKIQIVTVTLRAVEHDTKGLFTKTPAPYIAPHILQLNMMCTHLDVVKCCHYVDSIHYPLLAFSLTFVGQKYVKKSI